MSAAADFDRFLPAVFREGRAAEDPLRAVLGAFAHELDRIDRQLTRFPRQLDPAMARHRRGGDFLSWLAGWVAIDPTWVAAYPAGGRPPAEARREQLLRALVARAVPLHAASGTAGGTADWLHATTGARIELREWCWPRDFTIGLSSTVGIDGWIDDEPLPDCRLAVVIELDENVDLQGVPTRLSCGPRDDRLLTPLRGEGEEPTSPELDRWLRAVRRVLDAVLPGGIEAWVLVRPGAGTTPALRRLPAMIIGITSEIEAALIEAEA